MLPQIIINAPDADWTPPGKRRARIVILSQGERIRWYVSGRVYRTLHVTAGNIELSKQWVDRR